MLGTGPSMTVEEFCLRSLRDELAAELILDMDADDLLEIRLGLEAERRRALGVEVPRPAGDDLVDHRVDLAADALDDVVAGDLAQRLDLLGDGAGITRHGQSTARADRGGVHGRGM